MYSAGIGENSSFFRSEIIKCLSVLGIKLDEEKTKFKANKNLLQLLILQSKLLLFLPMKNLLLLKMFCVYNKIKLIKIKTISKRMFLLLVANN
ncbi:hypothetical protein ACEW7V_02855 [Areca yellow leaf disease phytoplasma]|uniref:hypothetical protein n=1 Tax=Areca yellow leaf disease phytoplasma TaxID=927614 RepID=UPI0035B534CB